MTTLLIILVFATINVGLGCLLFVAVLKPAAPAASAPVAPAPAAAPAEKEEEAKEEEPAAATPPSLEGEIDDQLSQIERHLAELEKDLAPDSVKAAADQFASAVQSQLDAWNKEYGELADEEETAERRSYLEQRIAQAETTASNLTQLTWDGEMNDVLARMHTEVKRMQRA